MRILFLTHRLPYAPNRGDRIRAFHILRTLRSRWHVDLVSLVHDDEEQAHVGELIDEGTTVVTARVRQVRAVFKGFRALVREQPLTHALLDAPTMKPILNQLLHEHRPDIVLAYCSGMARFAIEPPLAGTPFVLDMVDVDSAKWADLSRTASWTRRWLYRREARYLKTFEVLAARRAFATLVVNDRERELMSTLAPGARVRVIPNGVDLVSFRPPGPPIEEPRVTFCGVMNYRPNEEAAVWMARRVWPLVLERCPEAKLLLVGSDPTRTVRALAESDARIEVTGRVPDVRPYLWNSAVAVAPLRTARGVQNKVLEAIAGGLPCVVTPAVAQGLPKEAAAAYTVAEGPAEFARAILDLLGKTGSERRALAGAADMASLDWTARLAPLFDILERGAASRA